MKLYFRIFGWMFFPFVFVGLLAVDFILCLYERFVMTGVMTEIWRDARELCDWKIPEREPMP